MNAPVSPQTRRRRRLRSGQCLSAWAVIAALMLSAVMAGCGVRLETAPPTEPIPTAFEQVRRTAVADALRVIDLATAATATPGINSGTRAQLEEVIAFSSAHVDALGGVYESGIVPDDDELDLFPDPPPIEADPAKVVSALSDAASRNRAAADSISSGELARLLASIGASQLTSATILAETAAIAPPTPIAPVVPVVVDYEPIDGYDNNAQDPESPDAEASTDEPETNNDSPEIAVIVPGEAEAVAPTGLTVADFNALILGDDAARFALEVRAAIAVGEHRARLLEQSAVHSARALAWAHLAGVIGTQQDPREGVYSVPREHFNLTLSGDALSEARAEFDAALVRDLQSGLAINFASLVGTTAPATRTVLIELLAEADLIRIQWGGVPVAFPGLPELTEPAESAETADSPADS